MNGPAKPAIVSTFPMTNLYIIIQFIAAERGAMRALSAVNERIKDFADHF